MAERGQQTEKPTQRKLQKVRKEGQFPVSRELVSGIQFLVFVVALGAFGRDWLMTLVVAARVVMERAFQVEVTPAALRELLFLLASRLVSPLMVAGLMLIGAGLVSQLVTTQFGFAMQKLTPDFSRLSPARNLRNLRRQNLSRLVQALVLLPIFSLAVYSIAKDSLPLLLQLPFQTVNSGFRQITGSIHRLLWKGVYVFVIWGAVDFVRQRRNFEQDLRMSKQEVKDEAKEADGNPQVKHRIRRIQRDALRRRMMSKVPTATAVIVNPTHYAVAIRYEASSMATPVVVAKGKNYLALRIRTVAIENMIPIVENPLLAQALYKSVEVGQEIPSNFYRAIAEILAYIYKLRGMSSRWRNR